MLGVVAMHAFNPNTAGGRGRGISAFEASLVYRASFRRARATQTNPVVGHGRGGGSVVPSMTPGNQRF